MLASIVHPIIDLRPFLPGVPQRLPRPSWPLPQQREFVRSMGPIVPRPSGGVPVYGDENLVCDAERAIRLDRFAHAPFERFVSRPSIRCAFRRFFHDGAGTAKFEIGFALRSCDPISVSSRRASLFLSEIALLAARVPPHTTRPLIKLGGDLADAYLRASTIVPNQEAERCVHYGEPLMFVDVSSRTERIGPPIDSRAIPFLACDDEYLAGEVELSHHWLTVGNLHVRCWLLHHGQAADRDVRRMARFLRVMLTRIHTERQFLTQVLRRIGDGSLAPSPGSGERERLRSALDRSFKRLRQPRRSRVQRSTMDLYEMVLAAEDSAIPGALDGLRDRLTELAIGPTITRRASEFALRDPSATGSAPTAPSPVRVLFMAADPEDASRVATGAEYKAIKDRLRSSLELKRLVLEVELDVRPSEVAPLVATEKPRIVHFCAHGDGVGQLLLVGSNQQGAPLPPEHLAHVFQLVGANVRCVVLTACYSKIQAEMLAQHVDFVVGMSRAIDPVVAVEFVGAFYEMLAVGSTVDAAFQLAQDAAKRTRAKGYDAPSLFVRPGCDPTTSRLLEESHGWDS